MNRHSDQAPQSSPTAVPRRAWTPPSHGQAAGAERLAFRFRPSRARLGQHQRNRMCSLQFIRFSQFDASASLIITHIFRISTMNSFVKLKATTKPRFPRTFSQSENASEIQAPREIPPIGVSHGRIYRTPSHTWWFQERPTTTQTLVGRTYK